MSTWMFEPQIAKSIAERYRLEVKISDSDTCMARMRLMGDNAVNMRFDKIPPLANEENVTEYASQFGVACGAADV